MTTFLYIAGGLLAVTGFFGCLLPVIPGPLLSFLSLVLLGLAGGWETVGPWTLGIFGAGTALLSVLELTVPAAYARKKGATRAAAWGAILGMLLGIFFFPPWGMIVFALAGAVAFELAAGKPGREALSAGWAVLMGNLFVTGLKLGFTGVIAIFFIQAIFRH